jgi:hypothetical protein
MTVAELIETLKSMPQDSEVFAQVKNTDERDFVYSVEEDDNCGGYMAMVVMVTDHPGRS